MFDELLNFNFPAKYKMELTLFLLSAWIVISVVVHIIPF